MRCALVLLLAGPVLAEDDVAAARAAMEAQLKAGDELRLKGDLDGAVAAYRSAVTTFRETLKKKEAEKVVAEAKEPEAAPADDGTPEGRKRVVEYYVRLLNDPSDDVRYNAVATLGEMRAAEAKGAILAVLEKDKYQVARRAAAWSLGRLGKEGAPAIPALIREVGGEFPLLGNMCDNALARIAEAVLGRETTMGFKTEMTPAERLEIQKKWQEWLEANRAALGVPAEGPSDELAPAKPVEPKVPDAPAERPPEPPREVKPEGGG